MVISLLVAGMALAPSNSAPAERLYAGLGHHNRKITTSSPLAQKYFDQGMAFMNGFNHGEAIRSFQAATQADPNCAIAYWGIALANGTNINLPFVDPDRAKAAFAAESKAKELEGHASPVEKALIEALDKRYADPQPQDRSPLDKAYADAMRGVWHQFGRDADVGALFAEALMDLRPWNLWTLDGKPQDITPEVQSTIETVLRLDPNHPQGCHLYIHAMEASPTPWKALPYADRLRFMQPTLGHMVHMPSHIDIRVGHWVESEAANERAIAADASYKKGTKEPGVYRIYMTHNYHMLVFSAMMRGEGNRAISMMDKGVRIMPEGFVKELSGAVDGFLCMPIEVRARFGRWQEILDYPEFPDYLPISRAIRHADRAIAFSALGQEDHAMTEQSLFEVAAKKVPKDATFGNNSAAQLLTIARHMVAGEVLLGQKRYDESIVELRLAVQAEDQMSYDEPPDWIQPTRHTLGAALIQAGKYAEALETYRRDLEIHPNNGWATYGLYQAYSGLGKTKNASACYARYRGIWKDADVKIGSSCMCVPASR